MFDDPLDACGSAPSLEGQGAMAADWSRCIRHLAFAHERGLPLDGLDICEVFPEIFAAPEGDAAPDPYRQGLLAEIRAEAARILDLLRAGEGRRALEMADAGRVASKVRALSDLAAPRSEMR